MRSYSTIVVWLLILLTAGSGDAIGEAAALPAGVFAFIRDARADIERLDATQEREMTALAAFDHAYKSYDQKMQRLFADTTRAAKANDAAAVLAATKQMQETQMSFNLQYLQLQQKMQDESRRFTLLSNIMKTKHDTAKNSISNVR